MLRRFPASGEDAGLDIVSIHGLVTKSNLSRNSSELSITGIKDMIVDRIFNRRRRSIDDETSFKSNELNAHLFSDKNYEEYDTKEELNTTAWDTDTERNTSKRDLTDAVDLEMLVNLRSLDRMTSLSPCMGDCNQASDPITLEKALMAEFTFDLEDLAREEAIVAWI